MNKIGKFRGIPVYRTDSTEWRHTDTREKEALYVVESKVYYHDEKIGRIDDWGQLAGFDEDNFDYLKRLYEQKRNAGPNDMVEFHQGNKDTAEVAPQREESPVKESVDPAAAVDAFMANWENTIDSEIDVLQNAVSAMEDEFNAVG